MKKKNQICRQDMFFGCFARKFIKFGVRVQMETLSPDMDTEGGQKSPKKASKKHTKGENEKKRTKFAENICSLVVWRDNSSNSGLGSILRPWAPIWTQRGVKNRQKRHQKSIQREKMKKNEPNLQTRSGFLVCWRSNT